LTSSLLVGTPTAGGTGGAVTLISNSPTAFNVGNVAVSNSNGVQGAITVNGGTGKLNGSVTLVNNGGGVTYAPTGANLSDLQAVGQVEIEAGGLANSTNTININAPLGNNATTSIAISPTSSNAGNVSINLTAAIGGRRQATVCEQPILALLTAAAFLL